MEHLLIVELGRESSGAGEKVENVTTTAEGQEGIPQKGMTLQEAINTAHAGGWRLQTATIGSDHTPGRPTRVLYYVADYDA